MMKLVDENWFKFKKSFKVELGIVLQDKVGFLLQFLNARERKIRGIYLQLTEKNQEDRHKMCTASGGSID